MTYYKYIVYKQRDLQDPRFAEGQIFRDVSVQVLESNVESSVSEF